MTSDLLIRCALWLVIACGAAAGSAGVNKGPGHALLKGPVRSALGRLKGSWQDDLLTCAICMSFWFALLTFPWALLAPVSWALVSSVPFAAMLLMWWKPR